MRAVHFSIAFVLFTAPTLAIAQSPSRSVSQAPTSATQTPTAQHGVTPYTRAILDGIASHRQRDWAGALGHFRQAATLDPRSAEPLLFQGFTAVAQGEPATALEAFREAVRLATTAGAHREHGRALAAIATLQETQNRWSEARTAWQEYVTFADAHPEVTFGSVGRARIDVIRQRATRDESYESVRHRIEERRQLNASGATQEPPPPALPPSAITR